MKISVVVIAHNEEGHIRECLDSLRAQTQKPDEIILIAHNCTDKTVAIAQEYVGVTVRSYNGPVGIVPARIEGITHTTGDIILCIDGDSVAASNWIVEMTHTLIIGQHILVGSWVQFKGTLLGAIYNICNKFLCASTGSRAYRFVWGPSFGFWAKDHALVKDILQKSTTLSKQLGLSRNPEDLWLALYMSKKGNVEVTNKTYVQQYQKEKNSYQAFKRTRENNNNGRKIYASLKD